MGSVTASTTAKPILRVAAISGSLRSNSWHVGLIRAAEEMCEESIPGLRIDHIDISGLPMANPDLETDGGDGFQGHAQMLGRQGSGDRMRRGRLWWGQGVTPPARDRDISGPALHQ
ncbi:hypothetical protein VPH35_047771 [Triticum aestivum]